MEKFIIKTGTKRIAIFENEDDEKNGVEPRGYFEYNPQDVTEARKILELQASCQGELLNISSREKECKTELEKICLMEEFATKYRNQIDYIYGNGTSDSLFGKVLTYDSLTQFFEYLTEKYRESSKSRVDKILEETN